MHLPVELWHKVIGYATDLDSLSRDDFSEHLLPPISQESLTAKINISRVSRSFRRISHPFLFETVEVGSVESLPALEFALVHSHVAKTVSPRVVMLSIQINDLDHDDATKCDSVFQTIRRILSQTINLTALRIKLHFIYAEEKPKPSASSKRIAQAMASSVPPCVKWLTWNVRKSSPLVSPTTRAAVAACARELRYLAVTSYDQRRDKKSMIPLDLPSFTHLDLLYPFSQRDGIIRARWRLPVLAHVRTTGLWLNVHKLPKTFICPRVVSLELCGEAEIKMQGDELERIFPRLETLKYTSTTKNDIWKHTCHSTLHTIVINSSRNFFFKNVYDTQQQPVYNCAWLFLHDQLGHMNVARLPCLRTVTLRFAAGHMSGVSESRAFMEESVSHLMKAGVQVVLE